MATHKSVTDPLLRKIMAHELWVLRSQIKRMGYSRSSETYLWIVMGFETALRRVEHAQRLGER